MIMMCTISIMIIRIMAAIDFRMRIQIEIFVHMTTC